MDWPISPAGMQAVQAVKSGNASAAARMLTNMTVVDVLGICAHIAQTGGRPAFKQFSEAYWSTLSSPGLGLSRPAFALRVAELGSIPGDDTCGVDGLDYQFARQFILKARDEGLLVAAFGWPADPRATASTRPFYPEAIRSINAWRQRICTIATAHRDKGPISPQQWALLSLGSFYGMSTARNGARPSNPSAASILFARSVLHGAGCNVIHPGTSLQCMPMGGLFGTLPKHIYGYTPASTMELGARPDMGDVFHIEGTSEDRDGRKIETTHIGVIIGVWGNIWLTIEGGGPDNVTRQKTRELIPVNSPHGRWAFKYDDQSAKLGHRPLQGWFSVSKFRHDLWMSPRAESPN